MTIADYRNNCVPLALAYASGASHGLVLRVCLAHGFNKHGRGGMRMTSWVTAAQALGLVLTKVELPKPTWNGDYLKRTTLHHFQNHMAQQGALYLVRLRSHLLVVDDGLVHDPNCPYRTGKRRIWGVYQVTKEKTMNWHTKLIVPMAGDSGNNVATTLELGDDGALRFSAPWLSVPVLGELVVVHDDDAPGPRALPEWNERLDPIAVVSIGVEDILESYLTRHLRGEETP